MNSTVKFIIGAVLCIVIGGFILKSLKFILFLGLAAGIGYMAIKFVSSKKLEGPTKGSGIGDS